MFAGLAYMHWQERQSPGTLERATANLVGAATVQPELEE